MLKFFIICLLVFAASISLRAATGCVKNSDQTQIYTTSNGGTDYSKQGTTVPLSSGCAWNFVVPSTICTVSNPAVNGLLAVDSPQLCPIDDYIWVMMVLFGGLGYFAIRKNVLNISN